MGSPVWPLCTSTPRNCIKQLRQQLLFFPSMVFVFWEFSKLPLLNNVFSKKSRCGFFAFRAGRGNSLQARDDWAGKPAVTQMIPQRTRRGETQLHLCVRQPCCTATPTGSTELISPNLPYLPVSASPRTTNLFLQKGELLEHRKWWV